MESICEYKKPYIFRKGKGMRREKSRILFWIPAHVCICMKQMSIGKWDQKEAVTALLPR